jgi:hypothetical protein
VAYDVTMRDSDAAIIRGLRRRRKVGARAIRGTGGGGFLAVGAVSTDDFEPAEAESAV